MLTQPSLPLTDRWALHIAASPHRVDDILADLCLHQRARAIGDPAFPACLLGRGSPDEPPAWLSFVRAELERRGHRTRWCGPDCRHQLWPPATTPDPARRRRGRTSLRRLTGRTAHHRAPAPA
ncbi:hypothetical protein BJY16_005694 [Actinoplanes octamycinicus]|uniref:Uncharacterized protein n=1 Tax=Actinoplanes octamycinicus TaxID=135948 RepID=A0A7W7H1G5_9ACTN|nr:hypothetical protein [Actinoplanes octamycinicus]MBB4742235.1 hypothetical protein [Actinoplanes octamycinicus]GIE59920.1 hypothetical protein Aoc01nite_53220 [Actinoplanes octamycinicus]